MTDLTTLKRQHQLVTLTSTNLTVTGYIRSLTKTDILLIQMTATGHPDGWIWLNPEHINAVESGTPELALIETFVDLNRKHHPAFDPLTLTPPARNLTAWLALTVKNQTLIEIGLAKQPQIVTLTRKNEALTAHEITVETIDQPRNHVLEPAQLRWLKTGSEYLSLMNQVRKIFA